MGTWIPAPAILPASLCSFNVTLFDFNRCEDDVFDVYLIRNDGTDRFLFTADLVSTPPGCCAPTCPQTTVGPMSVTLTSADIQGCAASPCAGAVCDLYVGISVRFVSANCCNTNAQLIVTRLSPTTDYITSFGASGVDVFLPISDLC